MSRTDKDRPRWVRNNDETDGLREVHDHRPAHRWGWTTGKCELGQHDPRDWRAPCHVELADTLSPYGHVSYEDRHLYYWRCDRAANRLIHHRLMREWNSFGDCDDSEVRLDPARRAPFHGGWWD